MSAGEVNKFSEDLQKSFGPAKICLLDDNANKTLWHDASGNELDGVVQGRAILKSVKKSLHIDDVEVNNRVATNILNLLPTTVPPDPIIGDMYHSAADNLVYIYTESGWEEIRTK